MNLVRVACLLSIKFGTLMPEGKSAIDVSIKRVVGPFEADHEADAYVLDNPVQDQKDEWFIATLEAP